MKRIQAHKVFVCLFIACLLFLSSCVLSGRSILPAFADEVTYTGVLEDLQTDSEFNADDYPEKSGDYSVSVIQIAESRGGELFVYTYQPSQRPFVATDINMSLTEDFDEDAITDTVDNAGNVVQAANVTRGIGDGLGGLIGGVLGGSDTVKTQLYHLRFVSCNGVFYKYVVRDFTVSTDTTRYYNITSIYREWLKGIDFETGNDNKINEVAFPVGKCFKATTENGVVSYSCEKRKVIQILNPFWGYQRYDDGFILKTTACDSHYVAFTTDMRVDELYEADLSYQSRPVRKYYDWLKGNVTDYGEWEPHYAFLTDEQEFVKERTGWLWGSKKEYNRIQSVKEFIESEKLYEETKKALQGKEWVLRFAETDYSYVYDGSDYGNTKYTEVLNVTILRLKFKSAGKVYNLGAVSDKGTESPNPTNPPPWYHEKIGFWQFVWNCVVKLFKGTATLFEGFVAIVAILVVVIALPLLFLVLSLVFPAFGAVLKVILKGIWAAVVWLVKGLWWLICLPFKGIAALVRRSRGE